MLASVNIEGGDAFHLMSGNLSYQIEHHLFPDMPSNRLKEISPKVKAVCEEFGLPYNSGPFLVQWLKVQRAILRYAFPGGEERPKQEAYVAPPVPEAVVPTVRASRGRRSRSPDHRPRSRSAAAWLVADRTRRRIGDPAGRRMRILSNGPYTATIPSVRTPDEAFDYMVHFDNVREWDPSVSHAERLDDGPLRKGSRFSVTMSFVGRENTLEYEITEYDPTARRAVLEGVNGGTRSIDTITVSPEAAVTYDARVVLSGLLKLADPLVGLAFNRLGSKAGAKLREVLARPADRRSLIGRCRRSRRQLTGGSASAVETRAGAAGDERADQHGGREDRGRAEQDDEDQQADGQHRRERREDRDDEHHRAEPRLQSRGRRRDPAFGLRLGALARAAADGREVDDRGQVLLLTLSLGRAPGACVGSGQPARAGQARWASMNAPMSRAV